MFAQIRFNKMATHYKFYDGFGETTSFVDRGTYQIIDQKQSDILKEWGLKIEEAKVHIDGLEEQVTRLTTELKLEREALRVAHAYIKSMEEIVERNKK